MIATTASLLVLAGAVGAQGQVQQTPAGAQEFLRQISVAGNVKWVPDDLSQCGRPYLTDGRRFSERVCHTFQPYPARFQSVAENVCRTTVVSDAPQPHAYGRRHLSTYLSYTFYPPDANPFSLRWQQVAEVTQHAEVVRVNGRTFQFGSEALAVRAAYAMNFLKDHCDATAATGF